MDEGRYALATAQRGRLDFNPERTARSSESIRYAIQKVLEKLLGLLPISARLPKRSMSQPFNRAAYRSEIIGPGCVPYRRGLRDVVRGTHTLKVTPHCGTCHNRMDWLTCKPSVQPAFPAIFAIGPLFWPIAMKPRLFPFQAARTIPAESSAGCSLRRRGRLGASVMDRVEENQR